MHNVREWPNLRNLGQPLGGAKGLLEAASFNKVTESMGKGRVTNARWGEFQAVEAATLKSKSRGQR